MRVFYSLVFLPLIFMLCSCGDSDSLAKVNDRTITEAEFEAYLKFKRIRSDDERKSAKLLAEYVEREALAGVIEKEGLLDADLVQAELNEFRKEMFISRYFEQFLREKISDQAVQSYYNTHGADYEERQVHVAHVLIRTNKKMSEIERKAKLTTAHEVYSQLRSGKDFAEIAEAYSQDKVSAKKGGDLGWIKEGSIDPRFSKVVFELEPETVSEPFETAFGFHVAKVVEGPKILKRPFEAVAGDIRYQLRAKTKKAEMERLMGKAKVKRKKEE